jgi:hypothetical protein
MTKFLLTTLLPLVAFIVVSHPETYKLVRGVAGSWVASAEGLPKLGGLFLHAVVFVLLVSFLMRLLGVGRSGYAEYADPVSPPAGDEGKEVTAPPAPGGAPIFGVCIPPNNFKRDDGLCYPTASA